MSRRLTESQVEETEDGAGQEVLEEHQEEAEVALGETEVVEGQVLEGERRSSL